MYSVEDLLISHGYKVSSKTSVPPSHSPSSRGATKDERVPARSSSRCEIGEKRTGHGVVNGFKADCVYGSGGVGQTPSTGGPGDTESRDRKQRTEEDDNGNLGDGHSPGDSLNTDSGFPESHRGMFPQPRLEQDVSCWRRRGQDFNMLLDYADFRDPHGKRADIPVKAEGMPRRPESALSSEEHRRERQRRADSARARERELALYQWRMAAERKYQSLGTEEWRPAVGIGRQTSESEADRWAQEQRRPRTAEGAVPSRTKAKSQSLPRMPIPSDSLQYLSMSPSGQDPYGSYRINGHQPREPHKRNLSEGGSRERWNDNGRSGVQSAPPSKPRFSRPLRPPSYEVHQQMRGSSEMLSGEYMPHSRDRTPLPFSRQEYFAQVPVGSGMEPPGYIPPPSYRRQPAIRGGHRTYASSMGNYQYRGDPYMQGPAMAEVQEWFLRQTGMSWPDHHRDGRRTVPCRRQAYPGYNEERTGNVQYIPFDDPRVRHISGVGMDGNSLTDADKIRNIRKEIPVASLSEKSSDDSAFLLPENTFSSTQASKSNISDCVNDAVMHKEVSGQMRNSKSESDENSNRFSANHDYSNTFQMIASEQSSSSNQVFCDTVTQVKKFEAQTAAENKKNKKKLKETMFCLVSVPISVIANKEAPDPNNNENVPSSVVAAIENTAMQPYSQSLTNISVTSDPHTQPNSSSATRSSGNTPVRKETIDVWSHQGSTDKELCYAGSWPGDQYKNQETQTGSPEVCRSVHPPSHHTQPTYDPPLSDTTTDSGVGTECSVNHGYPMKGQKNLNFSSNSAFSRTMSGSTKSGVKSPAQHLTAPTLQSPDRHPPLTKSAPRPQASDGQEVWGQFLLKPVNRRPWDAIGELESFNKELQDQNSKNPSTDQTIEDLDEALQNILEVSNTCTEAVRPGRIPHRREVVSQPHIEQHPEQYFKTDNLNIRSDLESKAVSEANREYREVRSAFSRPKGRFTNPDIPLRQHNPVPKDSGFVNYEVMQRMQVDPGVPRLDIPVPKESLLKDVGLTVYTAIPDTVMSESPAGLSPESPMLTSPSDNSETCDALQITSSDSGGDRSRNSPEFSVDHQSAKGQSYFSAKLDHDNEMEKIKAVASSQKSPRNQVSRSQRFRHKASSDDDDLYSDYVSWCNEKTLADEHLETLLSQEKANSMPSEDLSNLYQVQSAKGIPVHESIEERAARILGIAVSAEALVVSHGDVKESEINADGPNKVIFAMQTREEIAAEDMWDVSRECEEVTQMSERSHEPKKQDPDVGKDTGSREGKTNKENHAGSVMVELPEFPPAHLRLSLPSIEDEELALSVCGGEKKPWNSSELSDGHLDRCASTVYPSSLMLKNEETSVEQITAAVEGEPVSCVRNVIKEMEKEREEEEMGEEGTEKLEQEEKVLEGERETAESEVRIEEGEADIEKEKDEGMRRENIQKEPKKEELQENQASKPMSRPVPQPRSGRVAKREITLPESFSVTTVLATAEDEDFLSVSDTYDPSRVERV